MLGSSVQRPATFGAASPLPRVPAKVSSPTLCGSPSPRIGNRCFAEFTAYARASRLWVRLLGANRVPVIAHRGAISFLKDGHTARRLDLATALSARPQII